MRRAHRNDQIIFNGETIMLFHDLSDHSKESQSSETIAREVKRERCTTLQA